MLYFLFGTISILYIIIIVAAIIGWKKQSTHSHSHTQPFMSVIVAARNEEDTINDLHHKLTQQTYNTALFEVIFVNDHSTDNTYNILEKNCKQYNHFHVFDAPHTHHGKKQAIQYGIQKSKGTYLLFTDADCLPTNKWIETFASYCNSNQSQLLFGSVNHKAEQTCVESFFSLDFLAMVGTQGGLAKINHPYSCNAANMCISLDLAKSNTQSHYASGDDVFLLHSAKSNTHTEIKFIEDSHCMVTTKPPKTVSAFLQQRIRWAGKSTGYKDIDTIVISNIIYLENASLFWSGILSIFYIQFAPIFLLLFTLKALIDLVFFVHILPYFKKNHLLLLSIPFQLFYFIYITLIPIFVIISPLKWKGRKIT
ncbi:MAG: glycosyltransferase [Bacteroidales bacterium]